MGGRYAPPSAEEVGVGIIFFCMGLSVTQCPILAKFVWVICYISERSPCKDHTSDRARKGILYSTTRYSIVQYSTVYYTILYCTVMYGTLLYSIVQYCRILYRKVLIHTIHVVLRYCKVHSQ